MHPTRRTFLAGLGAAGALALLPGRAAGIGPRSEVSVGQIRLGKGWDARPEALRRLLWETRKRTSIETAREAQQLTLDDDEMFYQPLLVLMGEGSLPRLEDRQRARLERHLRYGGMLWIDAPSPDDGFAKDARRLLAELVPGVAPEPLPKDHVLKKSFFIVEGAVGRTRASDEVFALSLGDRAAALLTECDVFGAYERDRFGTWRFECVPDGERQRERAFRFGVNVLMYATCLDYKSDQVHIPFIMKKSRR